MLPTPGSDGGDPAAWPTVMMHVDAGKRGVALFP